MEENETEKQSRLPVPLFSQYSTRKVNMILSKSEH